MRPIASHRWVLLALPFLVTACQRGQSGQAESEEQPAAMPMPEGPETMDTMRALPDTAMSAVEPEPTLRRARGELGTNAAAAATDIRSAAEYLRGEATDVAEQARSGLDQAATILDRLADDVDAGTARTEADLDTEFARVHRALAEDELREAREAWARDNHTTAGEELAESANHLQLALKYGGQETDAAAMTAVQTARGLAAKLEQNSGFTSSEVEAGMEQLETQIGDVQRRLGASPREEDDPPQPGT